MAWYNPFSWKRGVVYENIGGTHTYTLTTPEYGEFRSCFRGGNSDANVLTMFKTLPEVFAPINGIASRVCNGRFVVKRMSNDEIVYSKTELNKLLDSPNPFMRWGQFVYNAIVYKYSGNRYIYAKVPSTMSMSYKNISALWLLPPQYTQIHLKSQHPDFFDITTTSDLVEKYQVDWNGRNVFLDPRFVSHDTPIHIDACDTDSPLKGISPIVADEYPMSNLCAVYEARNVIYVKRGALGAIVSKKSDASGLISMTPSEKISVINDMQGSYGLSAGQSPFAITDVPVEWMGFGMSIKDLEPFTETKVCADAIAASLQYPPELLPSGEKQTAYANRHSAEKSLYQNVIINDGKEICNLINNLLNLREDGLYIDVSYDHIEVLQEDKKAAADTFKVKTESVIKLFDKGFITKNRGLVLLDEEEVSGFDVYSYNDPNKPKPIIQQNNPNEPGPSEN